MHWYRVAACLGWARFSHRKKEVRNHLHFGGAKWLGSAAFIFSLFPVFDVFDLFPEPWPQAFSFCWDSEMKLTDSLFCWGPLKLLWLANWGLWTLRSLRITFSQIFFFFFFCFFLVCWRKEAPKVLSSAVTCATCWVNSRSVHWTTWKFDEEITAMRNFPVSRCLKGPRFREHTTDNRSVIRWPLLFQLVIRSLMLIALITLSLRR